MEVSAIVLGHTEEGPARGSIATAPVNFQFLDLFRQAALSNLAKAAAQSRRQGREYVAKIDKPCRGGELFDFLIFATISLIAFR